MLTLEWIKIVTDLGSFGVVVWLVWHTFQITIPSLHEQFRDDLARERESAERSLGQISLALERLNRHLARRSRRSIRRRESCDS